MPANIFATCGGCAARIRGREALLGKTVKCPRCTAPVTFEPAADPEAVADSILGGSPEPAVDWRKSANAQADTPGPETPRRQVPMPTEAPKPKSRKGQFLVAASVAILVVSATLGIVFSKTKRQSQAAASTSASEAAVVNTPAPEPQTEGETVDSLARVRAAEERARQLEAAQKKIEQEEEARKAALVQREKDHQRAKELVVAASERLKALIAEDEAQRKRLAADEAKAVKAIVEAGEDMENPDGELTKQFREARVRRVREWRKQLTSEADRVIAQATDSRLPDEVQKGISDNVHDEVVKFMKVVNRPIGDEWVAIHKELRAEFRKARSEAAKIRYTEKYLSSDGETRFLMKEGQRIMHRLDAGVTKLTSLIHNDQRLALATMNDFHDILLGSGRTGGELKQQLLEETLKPAEPPAAPKQEEVQPAVKPKANPKPATRVTKRIVGVGSSKEDAEDEAEFNAHEATHGTYEIVERRTSGIGKSWTCVMVIRYDKK